MTFGERLKVARLMMKLTQQQVAESLNKGRSTIAGYEVDDRLPDFDTLKKIAIYFNLSIDHLVGIEVNEEEESYVVKKRTFDISNLTDKQIEELESFKKFIISRDRPRKQNNLSTNILDR